MHAPDPPAALRSRVSVRVDLRQADLLRANFWYRYRGWGTRLLIAISVLANVALLMQTVVTGEVPPGTALLLLLLPLYFICIPLFLYFNVRRAFAQMKPFQKEIVYGFREDSYSVADGKSSSEVSWESVTEVVETEQAFHLFLHKAVFHILPKRCFDSPTDILRLRTLLKTALGTAAKVR